MALLQKGARLVSAKHKDKTHPGGEMTEDKQAELYTCPGGKFIRADTLPRVLAH